MSNNTNSSIASNKVMAVIVLMVVTVVIVVIVVRTAIVLHGLVCKRTLDMTAASLSGFDGQGFSADAFLKWGPSQKRPLRSAWASH